MWKNLTALTIVLLMIATAAAQQIDAPQARSGQTESGATSIADLRQAYLDMLVHKHLERVDKLFLWTGVPEETRRSAVKHFSEPRPVVASAEIKDPDPATLADYKRFHAHFNAPVLKMLTVHFVRSPNGDGETEEQLFIGQSQGRFYFVTSVQQPSEK